MTLNQIKNGMLIRYFDFNPEFDEIGIFYYDNERKFNVFWIDDNKNVNYDYDVWLLKYCEAL